jgi:hypothetical protein
MPRSVTFESHTFGINPERALEQKQAREQRESRRIGESLGKRWSSAREAAEALFDLPAEPVSPA